MSERRIRSGDREGHMETAIGIFASRDHAEGAVKELRKQGVPEGSIVFLTRSEKKPETVAKAVSAYVGCFVGWAAGMLQGVVAAALLLPGVARVFALDFVAAAHLDIAGAVLHPTVSRD